MFSMLNRFVDTFRASQESIVLYVGHRQTTFQYTSDGNNFPIYSPKIVFKTISTKHTQQYEAFELKYLTPIKAINLVATLQYKLAGQRLVNYQLNFIIIKLLVKQQRRNVRKMPEQVLDSICLSIHNCYQSKLSFSNYCYFW